jgi:phenylacetate-CoA ligase
MGFFRLRSPPGTAWPPIPPSEVSQVWAAYQALDRTQWLGPDELEELQFQQLRALIRHCFHEVPYYRRVLSDAGLPGQRLVSLSDFRRLPALTRELYQAHSADLKARSLPSGMVEVGGSYTSGTNGVPVRVLKTNRDALWWSAYYLRDLEWSGLDPRGRLAVIRLMATSREDLPRALEGVSYPYWTPFCELLLESGPSFGMDIRQEPRRQLAWLRKLRPDYLLSLPSNLEFLAGLVAESGQPVPGLRAIQAIGEPLSRPTRERIEAGFGVPVKNLYSTTETGYVASPCPSGHGLHVHGENVLAEVLDAEGRPCGPGETGRLVITSLTNFLTPFLRYDILDDVTLAPWPCPCGRGLPLWAHVDGRRHPLLHLAGGRRKAITGLYLEIRKLGGCHQFQIIQRAVDHVLIRVVPDRSWGPDHPARLRQVVRAEMDPSTRVEVEVKERIEPSPGGKVRIAIIEMEGGIRPRDS